MPLVLAGLCVPVSVTCLLFGEESSPIHSFQCVSVIPFVALLYIYFVCRVHTMAFESDAPTEEGSILPPLLRPSFCGGSSTCEICCERVPLSSLRGCGECCPASTDLPGRYCRTCLATHWHSLIFSGAHSRVVCICGGSVSDADIADVCSERTCARMLYFRSRDQHKDKPHVLWCPRDGCWALISAPPAANATHVDCPQCHARICYKCEVEDEPGHVCPPRRQTAATALNSAVCGAWALVHTKSCPTCHAPIAKGGGCAHVSCSRCSAYFCWRCKGYLHSGAPLRGRACVCDKVMTVAVQAGLLTLCIVGSPIWITAAVVGAGPYAVYRLDRRRKARSQHNAPNPAEARAIQRRPGRLDLEQVIRDHDRLSSDDFVVRESNP